MPQEEESLEERLEESEEPVEVQPVPYDKELEKVQTEYEKKINKLEHRLEKEKGKRLKLKKKSDKSLVKKYKRKEIAKIALKAAGTAAVLAGIGAAAYGIYYLFDTCWNEIATAATYVAAAGGGALAGAIGGIAGFAAAEYRPNTKQEFYLDILLGVLEGGASSTFLYHTELLGEGLGRAIVVGGIVSSIICFAHGKEAAKKAG